MPVPVNNRETLGARHTLSNPPAQSYVICSTPRTGSTLLCALLQSTGVAGQPQSYFRKEDTGRWAKRWNLSASRDAPLNFKTFLGGALSAGRSENGVFATRIMWGTMDELVDNLSLATPSLRGSDVERLERAFGPTRFIFIRRQDEIAQAVSWARAEQTQVWHRMHGADTPRMAREPVFDFDQIDTLLKTVRTHNQAWLKWFDENQVTPHTVTYETLDREPVATVSNILEHLNLDVRRALQIQAGNIRLADELSEDWKRRYLTEAGKLRPTS